MKVRIPASFGLGIKPEVTDADTLGGKGAGLIKMSDAGFPVPPGFILSTDNCLPYLAGKISLDDIRKAIKPWLERLEKHFGYMPLLSVRSGAKISMPGFMDTILNVGLDLDTQHIWAARLGEECTNDSFSRLVEMFGNVVHGVERSKFAGKTLPQKMGVYANEVGQFPHAEAQLEQSIEAVFKSWNNERANTYRKINGISDDMGTAVVIQAMVFGNFNMNSGSGVAFSRDYSTGEKKIVGDYLPGGQGEEVVAGISNDVKPLSYVEQYYPEVATALAKAVIDLELMYRDMVDIEFTVQDGTFYLLQCRPGKRTALAAVKIAMDMVNEDAILFTEAIQRVSYKQFLGATRPVIAASWKEQNPAAGKGEPASNGIAIGKAVFSSAAALMCNEPCILLAHETTPDDIAGMNAAVGILTATGGSTSHAAVVARDMNKVCVVGCQALQRGKAGDVWHLNNLTITEGSIVAIDGETGEIWVGQTPVISDGADKPEVAAFRNMVTALYPRFEVATCAAEVAGKQKVMLQCAAMGGEEKLILECLEAFTGEAMVIDARASVRLMSEKDQNFLRAFGAMHVGTLGGLEVAGVYVALDAFKGDRSKIWLLNSEIEGYQTLPTVTTLDQLLEVDGLCVPDFEKLKNAVGAAAVKKIVELRRKAGEKVHSFNVINTKVAPDVFATGAVLAMSDQVLLASVLAP